MVYLNDCQRPTLVGEHDAANRQRGLLGALLEEADILKTRRMFATAPSAATYSDTLEEVEVRALEAAVPNLRALAYKFQRENTALLSAQAEAPSIMPSRRPDVTPNTQAAHSRAALGAISAAMSFLGDAALLYDKASGTSCCGVLQAAARAPVAGYAGHSFTPAVER